MEAICKNCSVSLQAGDDYCPKCSQKTQLHRLSMHEVAHEGLHYFTHADKGLFQLIRDLTLRSGVVAREYIAGKRKKYFSPLNFFLLVAAINLFAINADETSARPDIAREHADQLKQMKDPKARAAFIKMYERQLEAVNFIRHHSNKTVLIILPIMSFIFWLFFLKSGYNFTEHLVAGMYMYGYCTLVFAGLALLNLIFKLDINVIYGLTLLLQLFYFTRFYYRLMGNSKAPRAFVASLTAIICVFIVTGVAVMIYMIPAFNGR